MYRIRCHVWGGITGDRIDYLKNKDLSVWETGDRDEAQVKAIELNNQMNNMNAKASFRYTVVSV